MTRKELEALVRDLRASGVETQSSNGKVRLRIPANVAPELMERVKSAGPELRAYLLPLVDVLPDAIERVFGTYKMEAVPEDELAEASLPFIDPPDLQAQSIQYAKVLLQRKDEKGRTTATRSEVDSVLIGLRKFSANTQVQALIQNVTSIREDALIPSQIRQHKKGRS